ncbi:MAG TPA: hypothetical protein VEU30_12560 [Thermoanaerobaculia bacterium]|nr:hypothetical protein [Thermoanaerobaculia bacterium]
MRSLPAFALLLFLACANDAVTRDEWQEMPRDERLLYVRALLGEEQAKDAKGGRGATYDRPAEEYVGRIDAAYARGEGRNVREIWTELATSR